MPKFPIAEQIEQALNNSISDFDRKVALSELQMVGAQRIKDTGFELNETFEAGYLLGVLSEKANQ